MSDLGSRLAEVLRSESESAPEATGLADAARSRARARRRTRLAAVGAVAVLALAVPLGVVVRGGSGEDGGPPSDAVDSTDVPGTRTESWRGVTLEVPESWEHGYQYAWCADGGSVETFRISRPGGVSPMIACTPSASYGLQFQEIDDGEPFDWPVVTQTGDGWPPGTYVGAHGEGGVLVTVAGPDREQLLDVLATISSIGDGVDPNGCAATESASVDPPSTGMSLCRYVDGRLDESGRLDEADTVSAENALETAPIGDLDCAPSGLPAQIVLMRSARHEARLELDGSCQTFVLDGGPGHIVSIDLREWARLPGDLAQ
jgi:hypothetical protein